MTRGWWWRAGVVLVAITGMVSTLAAQAAHQVLVDLAPSDDAHTYNLNPGASYGSDPTLNIGKVSNSPLELYRGHFRFDLSALGAMPAIVKAELHWYQTSSSGGGLEVDLHALTTPWTEGTLTWSTQPTPGTELLNQDVGGAAGWYVWDITCLARDWASGIAPNHGVVIKDPETAAGATRPGFGVSKEGTVGQRPFLRVLANVAYGAEVGGPRGSVERRVVPLTFRLVDPGAGISSATITFSTDGGVTYAPGGGGMATGSALGTLGRIGWDSLAAGVGLGGVVPVRVRLALSGAGAVTLDYDFLVDNAPACACTMRIAPAADVTLRNRNQCEPPGQEPDLILGKEHNSPPQWNRGLFAFDLSWLPPATVVTSATFGYYQSAGGGAGGLPVMAHRITQAWSEELVTWPTTPTWDAAALVSVSVGDVFANGYQLFDITAAAQGWIAGTFPNHGILIKDGETSAGAWRESHGHAREHGDPTRQPYLELVLGSQPLACVISAPVAGSVAGDVAITYSASSGVGAPATLAPRFSTDGGSTWASMTPGVGGDGTSGLATSAAGTPHTFVWESASDLPPALGPTPVTIELELDDGVTTSTCRAAFTVDNTVVCAVTLCGDCNGDGTLNILDALTAAQHAAAILTLVGVAFSSCNVLGVVEPAPGASVDILDALAIAQAAAGLPVTLVCC